MANSRTVPSTTSYEYGSYPNKKSPLISAVCFTFFFLKEVIIFSTSDHSSLPFFAKRSKKVPPAVCT
ncbi:MAG: hypothetical protein EBZ28_05655 [Alphaproteobacteria bacterium]|nr:hypothetical protein [Alphaproteobacteria bacterium]